MAVQILNDFLIKLIIIQVFSLILASLTIVKNVTILILSDHFTTRYYVISKKNFENKIDPEIMAARLKF